MDSHEEHFKHLGTLDKTFYFYVKESCEIISLTPAQIVLSNFLDTLAPKKYWEDFKDSLGEHSTYKEVGRLLIAASKKKGKYSTELSRGTGAHIDNKRCVYHLGNKLLVNGAKTGLWNFDSEYLYEETHPHVQVASKGLSNKECENFIDICNQFTWTNPKVDATVAAGWIAVAPICGVLKHRPILSINGEAESGKSTFSNKLVAPVLGQARLHMKGVSTLAGYRRAMGPNTIPVIVDEAEGKTMRDNLDVQDLLSIPRQGFDDGGQRYRASQSGEGVVSSKPLSSFSFSNIKTLLTEPEDTSRTLFLRVEKRSESAHHDLENRLLNTITPKFAEKFLFRAVKNMRVTLHNSEIFNNLVRKRLSNGRKGDILGVILAGRWSLCSKKRVNMDSAERFIADIDFDIDHFMDGYVRSFGEEILSYILQASDRRHGREECTVQELLQKTYDGDRDAKRYLLQWTMKFEESENPKEWRDEPYLLIGNKGNLLGKHMSDPPFNGTWADGLLSLPGAKKITKQQSFGKGNYIGAVCIPVHQYIELMGNAGKAVDKVFNQGEDG